MKIKRRYKRICYKWIIENIRDCEVDGYIDYYFYFGRSIYVASYKLESKDIVFNSYFLNKKFKKLMKILYNCGFKKILEKKISNDYQEKI